MGDIITAKKNQKILTRNYADWKLLKDVCRQSATCDGSDDEDVLGPDEVVADEHLQGAEQPKESGDTEQRWAIRDRPQRKMTSTNDSKYKVFISVQLRHSTSELLDYTSEQTHQVSPLTNFFFISSVISLF